MGLWHGRCGDLFHPLQCSTLIRSSIACSFRLAAFKLPRIGDGKHVTIVFMLIAVFAIHLLSWMFLIGLAGSSVVVLISFYEDAVELFGKDE